MSDAPERIWLDGDATIDEGVFPRCFATPKPASDPPMEFVRADLHAAAIARAERAEIEAAFFQGEVKLRNRIPATADPLADLLRRAERAEAALAVAEEALLFYADKAAWTQPPIRVLEGEFGPAYENEASQMQRDRGKLASAALAKIAALKGGAE